MPRLTAREYLRIHAQLEQFWDHDPAIFSYLTPKEQWILHDFFKPVSGLGEQELLAHRAAIMRERRSLPQQAGRTLSKLYAKSALLGIERVRAKQKVVPAGRGNWRKQEERSLSVRPLARPEIDASKLARAFTTLAIQRARKRLLGDQAEDRDVDQERSRP